MYRTLAIRVALLASISLILLAVPLAADGPHPLEVAAHFLSLSEEQVGHVVAVRQAAQEVAAPVVQELAARRTALGELVGSDEPNPAEIGVLVLSIRALEEQVVAIHREAAGQIRAMLDEEQLDRLETAAAARPVCRAIPALTALHLL